MQEKRGTTKRIENKAALFGGEPTKWSAYKLCQAWQFMCPYYQCLKRKTDKCNSHTYTSFQSKMSAFKSHGNQHVNRKHSFYAIQALYTSLRIEKITILCNEQLPELYTQTKAELLGVIKPNKSQIKIAFNMVLRARLATPMNSAISRNKYI